MDSRISQIDIKTALSAIADLVMPRVCVVCGRNLIPREKDICIPCLAELPETHYFKMSRNPMADKFNEKMDDIRYCYASALFFYNSESPYKNIPQALKYRRNFSAGRRFAAMLGSRINCSELFRDVDLVIPVPLSRKRRWKRGYNQAEVIAAEVADVLNAELDCNILKRKRDTRSQTRLSVSEKVENVRDAFEIRKGFKAKGAKHILLVDDVFTTGATTAECHRTLRTVFGPGTRISVVSLAFVSN